MSTRTCMEKKPGLILGYTRTGIAVCLPTLHRPALETFVGWSRNDHVDASRILMEHGEREVDAQFGGWCVSWARAHRALVRSTRGARREAQVRGAAETAILARRRRS